MRKVQVCTTAVLVCRCKCGAQERGCAAAAASHQSPSLLQGLTHAWRCHPLQQARALMVGRGAPPLLHRPFPRMTHTHAPHSPSPHALTRSRPYPRSFSLRHSPHCHSSHNK